MRRNFAEGGLRKWVSEKWVDIGAPKKDGKISAEDFKMLRSKKKTTKKKKPSMIAMAMKGKK